jgi:glycogen(starch) synthase
MDEMISQPQDYGIYIVDRRMKSIEESVNQLTDHMLEFCLKSRRQRINQRNRTERLSDLLDWKRMGLEYIKARYVAVRRKWPHLMHQIDDDRASDSGDEFIHRGYESDKSSNLNRDDFSSLAYNTRVPRPSSAPGSPKTKLEDGLEGMFRDDDDEENDSKPSLRRTNSTLIRDLKTLGINGVSAEYLKSNPLQKEV